MTRLSDCIDGICVQCGYSHLEADRLRVLRRLLPATAAEIADAWPCYWSAGENSHCTASRVLIRDLRKIGASPERVSVGGYSEVTWYLP